MEIYYLNSTGLRLTPSTISTSQNFTVSVTVTNTGPTDGKEVVQVRPVAKDVSQVSEFSQVYLTDVVSSVATPNQQLVGFQKVAISYVCPSCTVSSSLLSNLMFTNHDPIRIPINLTHKHLDLFIL